MHVEIIQHLHKWPNIIQQGSLAEEIWQIMHDSPNYMKTINYNYSFLDGYINLPNFSSPKSFVRGNSKKFLYQTLYG